RRLAATRLADDAERLALGEREGDVVDRVHVPDCALDEEPGPDREVDLEMVDLEQLLVAVRGRRQEVTASSKTSPIWPLTWRRSRLACGSSQQRSRWAGASGTRASSGGTCEHISNSCGHRVRKWQPCG